MATIPADFIEQVRQSTDIVGVVSKYVPLKRAGASFKALCPFHKEKTPSFNVSPDRQIFHCFGCGQGGDAFKFLMLYEKMSFTEAVSHLADSAGLAMPTTGRQGRGQTRDDRSLLLRLHEEAARFFQSQLTKHPGGRRALAYLRERGLTTKTVEDMGFGYAPDSWTALLEHLTRRGAKPEQLAHAGLVVPRREGGGYYDRFRSRIIIPIRSESGKVVAFGGRILGPGEPKYLNSPESAIYAKSRTLYGLHRAKDPIRSAGYAILMEGYLDCIQAYQVGIGNAVACCGTSLTSGHASLLRRYTDRAVVNFDPDQAGEAATRRSIDLLIEEGFEVKVLHLPGGEDPDSFIRNRGADAYREGLADATPFVDYLMCTAAARYDVGSPRGKAEFLNEVLPTLARVPNHVERVAYVSRLAERAEISDDAVVEELRRQVMARSTRVRPTASTGDSLKPAERDLVRWLLHAPTEAAGFLADIQEEDLVDLPTAPIVRAMKEVVAKEKLTAGRVLDRLSTEADRSLLTRIALEPSPLGPRQSPRDCLNRLREQRWRRELSRLRARQRVRLAEGGDDENITAEIQALSRRIETLGRTETSA